MRMLSGIMGINEFRTGRFLTRGLTAALFLLLAAPQVPAGNFRVTPIRLEFERGAKSGAVSVINEGKEPMTFQVAVSEWNQDEKGNDIYRETADIIFFPKIMRVEPGAQQVIRVGTTGAPPDKEKTYRLFIQQLPAPVTESGRQSTLSIAIRFAPPIFRLPLSPRRSGMFEHATLSRGVLSAAVRNTGTVHFLINTISARGLAADGAEVFSREVKGWYLLQGAVRTYEIPVPKEHCARLSRIDLTMQSDTITLNRSVDVRADMCSQ